MCNIDVCDGKWQGGTEIHDRGASAFTVSDLDYTAETAQTQATLLALQRNFCGSRLIHASNVQVDVNHDQQRLSFADGDCVAMDLRHLLDHVRDPAELADELSAVETSKPAPTRRDGSGTVSHEWRARQRQREVETATAERNRLFTALELAEMTGDSEAAAHALAGLLEQKDAKKPCLCFNSLASIRDTGEDLLLIDIDLDKLTADRLAPFGMTFGDLQRLLASTPYIIAGWRSRSGRGLHGVAIASADPCKWSAIKARIKADYPILDEASLTNKNHTFLAMPGWMKAAYILDPAPLPMCETSTSTSTSTNAMRGRVREGTGYIDADERDRRYLDAMIEALPADIDGKRNAKGRLGHVEAVAMAGRCGRVWAERHGTESDKALICRTIHEATGGHESLTAIRKCFEYGETQAR